VLIAIRRLLADPDAACRPACFPISALRLATADVPGCRLMICVENCGLMVSPLGATLASASTVCADDQFDTELWVAGF
jgi:hypothetical protein